MMKVQQMSRLPGYGEKKKQEVTSFENAAGK